MDGDDRTPPSARAQGLLRAQLDLMTLPSETPEVLLLRSAIDHAVDLTGSAIGSVHYVNPDQESLELCTWSTSTADYCTAAYDRHYPISRAGIWADSARLLCPQVHNDYATVESKRGLPPGHAPLHRHLGVPVHDDGTVFLLLGVGNAQRPYTQADVEVTQAIGDTAWEAVMRLREYEEMRTRLALLGERQQVVGLATWEWDPYTDDVRWDHSAASFIPGFPADGGGWDPLRRILLPEDAARLDGVLRDPGDEAVALELAGRDEDGERVNLLLQGYWAQRPQGQDRLLRGTLLDMTLHVELDRVYEAATHDVLTGLPNRAWLAEELERRLAAQRHRVADAFAVHFIDFDGFKAVNDQYGHMVGDEVLRECATRLQETGRFGESVARYGGDEFVMIQDGPVTKEWALALAHRVREVVRRPVALSQGGELCVAASIGVAVCSNVQVSISNLLRQADSALYEAKRRGSGVEVTDVV